MSGTREAEATWSLNMGGDFEERANANAESADKLQESIDRDVAALRAMQKALSNLKSGALGSTEQAKKLRDQIVAQKSSIGATQQKLLLMGRDWTSLGKAAVGANTAQISSLERFSTTLQGSSSGLGAMLQRSKALIGTLGKGGVAGAVALAVVAFAALVVAAGAATVALAAYALRVLDARRSELLRFEGLTKMPNYWGIAAGKAKDLQDAVDLVTSRYDLGRDKVVGFAASLYRAGLRGKNLSSALEGTSIRAAVLGEEMGQAFAGMAMGAALTGRSVVGMTEVVKRQLGGIAARQMLSFSAQIRKARENLDAMFRGVHIEGFLGRFAVLTELFSQTSATGRAVKVMLEALLNPLFGSAENGAPILKRFFQGIVIGALYVTIAILKLQLWFKRAFAGIKLNVDWARIAVYGGVGAFALMTASVVALTVTVGTLAAALGAIAAINLGAIAVVMGAIGGAVYGVVVAFKWLLAWGTETWRNLTSIDWSAVGRSILEGIRSGIGALWNIGVELGKRLLKGFKDVWGIASPSKLSFKLMRRDIAGGFIGGAKAAAPTVAASVGAMAFPNAGAITGGLLDGAQAAAPIAPASVGAMPFPAAGATTPSSGATESRRSGVTLTIQELNVHPSGDRPEDAARETVSLIAQQLEVALVQMGAL